MAVIATSWSSKWFNARCSQLTPSSFWYLWITQQKRCLLCFLDPVPLTLVFCDPGHSWLCPLSFFSSATLPLHLKWGGKEEEEVNICHLQHYRDEDVALHASVFRSASADSASLLCQRWIMEALLLLTAKTRADDRKNDHFKAATLVKLANDEIH